MEDEIWYMKQQSRVLQEFRREIQGFWDDEAAREMNVRYLNPHEDDDTQMTTGLDGQQNALQEAQVKLTSASEHALRAEKLSVEVLEQLELAEQDVSIAYQFYEQYRDYHSHARSFLPEIEKLIAEANSVCRGVAKE